MAMTQPHVSLYANAIYYHNSKVYRGRPPSSLSLAFVSHIFYAHAWPTSDGTISLSDELADTEIEIDGTQGCIAALTQLKQIYPDLKIILSVGGKGPGSAQFSRIASDKTLRLIFARSARTLVDMYDFDGLDIDWDNPSFATSGSHYLSLLTITREYLPEPYVLTSAIPAASWVLTCIDAFAASFHLTYLNLKAYGFSGSWSPLSGHQAQLYSPSSSPHSPSVHSAVMYLLSLQVPPSKILVGIPCYGHAFPGAFGPGEPYQPAPALGNQFEDNRTMDYAELPRPGYVEREDETVGGAWCIDAERGWISHDNVITVKMKAGYVQSMRLGGLFYQAGTGDVPGPRSLVEAGYNALHNQ